MGEEKGYNGWSNYETWATALWIDNEEGTYSFRVERVQEIAAGAEASEYRTREQDARYEVADWLKEWVTDELMPELEASLASDLLGAALSEINWYEIAENWLEDVEIEDEDEDEDEDGGAA